VAACGSKNTFDGNKQHLENFLGQRSITSVLFMDLFCVCSNPVKKVFLSQYFCKESNKVLLFSDPYHGYVLQC